MTDNEIVKALECLRGKHIFCRECKYSAHLHYRECQQAAANDALDLINRQRAEIEKWKKNCDELYEQMSERLKAELEIERRLSERRAIKEFAERLKKEEFYYDTEDGYEGYVVEVKEIDNLVKEMVGDVG